MGGRLFSAHMISRGIWGHAPPGNILCFGLSEIASGVLSGTTF